MDRTVAGVSARNENKGGALCAHSLVHPITLQMMPPPPPPLPTASSLSDRSTPTPIPQSRSESPPSTSSSASRPTRRRARSRRASRKKAADKAAPFAPIPTKGFIPPTPLRRKQTSRACTNCVKAKAGCDQNRPCSRYRPHASRAHWVHFRLLCLRISAFAQGSQPSQSFSHDKNLISTS